MKQKLSTIIIAFRRMGVKNQFINSLNGFKNVYNLTLAALLLAIQVTLNMTVSIQLTQSVRISFGHLALSLCGALLGPMFGAVNGALSDLIGFVLRPTGPYFPGFTLTSLLSGVIYGLMLYGKQPELSRIAITAAIIVVFCNMTLNTIWVGILYGWGAFVSVALRAIKNVVQFPVDVALMMLMLKALTRIKIPKITSHSAQRK